VVARTIARTGAPDRVEELIGTLAATAFAALDAAPLAEPGKSMIAELAHAAVDRAA
jgi:geranylgeranyl diphosphate synthase type I